MHLYIHTSMIDDFPIYNVFFVPYYYIYVQYIRYWLIIYALNKDFEQRFSARVQFFCPAKCDGGRCCCSYSCCLCCCHCCFCSCVVDEHIFTYLIVAFCILISFGGPKRDSNQLNKYINTATTQSDPCK